MKIAAFQRFEIHHELTKLPDRFAVVLVTRFEVWFGACHKPICFSTGPELLDHAPERGGCSDRVFLALFFGGGVGVSARKHALLLG